MRYELSIAKGLLPNLTRSTLPNIVLLGFLSAIFEGIGLYLFLPLLTVVGGEDTAKTDIPRYLTRLVDSIPNDWQVPALVALVFVSVLLKAGITYWNAAYFATI